MEQGDGHSQIRRTGIKAKVQGLTPNCNRRKVSVIIPQRTGLNSSIITSFRRGSSGSDSARQSSPNVGVFAICALQSDRTGYFPAWEPREALRDGKPGGNRQIA